MKPNDFNDESIHARKSAWSWALKSECNQLAARAEKMNEQIRALRKRKTALKKKKLSEEYDECDRELEEGEIDEQIETIKEDLACDKDVSARITRARRDFWLACSGKEFFNGEYCPVLDAGYYPHNDQSLAYEREYGVHFPKAKASQVTQLLAKLDEASPEWDLEDAGRKFFYAFEREFSEQMAAAPTPPRQEQHQQHPAAAPVQKKGSGCMVAVCALIALVVMVAIL